MAAVSMIHSGISIPQKALRPARKQKAVESLLALYHTGFAGVPADDADPQVLQLQHLP